MARYVVRYAGEGSRPEEVVRKISELPGASIVDDSGRMLLVDAPNGALDPVVGNSGDWLVTPEKQYPVPDTRRRIANPPGGKA